MIKNVVFEGGGFRGAIAYAGVLTNLEKNGLLESIDNVLGTSIGSMIGALLCVGYSGDELGEMLLTDAIDVESITSTVFPMKIWNLITKQGIHSSRNIEHLVEKLIYHKTKIKNMTLKQLNDLGYPNLYATIFNLNLRKHEVVSYKTHPDVTIAKIVSISCSIPILFTSTKFGKYKYCDGGVTGNYGIEYFDDKGYDKKDTIGFRIDSRDEIDGIDRVYPSWNVLLTMSNVCEGMFNKANSSHLKKYNHDRTTYIDDCGVDSTDFNITLDKMECLYGNGLDAKIKMLD